MKAEGHRGQENGILKERALEKRPRIFVTIVPCRGTFLSVEK
jgi:hypothetical protein